jgi:hypothetical protein
MTTKTCEVPNIAAAAAPARTPYRRRPRRKRRATETVPMITLDHHSSPIVRKSARSAGQPGGYIP